MSRPPAPLPDSVPWRVFTRAEALEAGISRERLRRSDLIRLRSGLLVRAGWELTEADIAAAVCRNDRRAVVAGLSAARMQGIPLPDGNDPWSPDDAVDIAIPGGRRGSDTVVRWRGLVLGAEEVWTATCPLPPGPDGTDMPRARVRLTTRARTWRDLAAELSHEWLVVIADHLVRRPRPALEQRRTAPWCTIGELQRACAGRHAEALRRALVQVRIGADSPRETLLRLAFVRAGLPEPELNVPLVGTDGRRRHSPDFLWPQFRVCVEYEGMHHNEKKQIERDIERSRRVRAAGWVEVRLFSKDVKQDCAAAVRLVRDALTAGGWRP